MPFELKATERDTTLNPRQLRSAGFVPATLYGGAGKESLSIQVRAHEWIQSFAAGNREYKLAGVEGDVTARVQQYQMDPVSRNILSIEFRRLENAAGKKAAAKPAKAAEPVAEAPAEELAAAVAGTPDVRRPLAELVEQSLLTLDGAGLGDDPAERVVDLLADAEPGDTVSVMLSNTPPMLEAHQGVPMTGAVLNTLNTRLDADVPELVGTQPLRGVHPLHVARTLGV